MSVDLTYNPLEYRAQRPTAHRPLPQTGGPGTTATDGRATSTMGSDASAHLCIPYPVFRTQFHQEGT